MNSPIHCNPIAKLQKRFFAWGMSKTGIDSDRATILQGHPQFSTLADLKQSLFADLQGAIVEIGPGAGVNLAYYPKNLHWTGIEPNPFMHPYLQQEAEKLGCDRITLYQGFAETIPVEENSIDTVISTHVLCSVQHLQTSLKEIIRILKPGGKFIFIEHIAAPLGTGTRIIQDSVQPLWTVLFDRCHPNRETGEVLQTMAFESLEMQHFSIAFPIVSPHVAGIALAK